ncbi:MAG: hypothetical protein U0S36_06655 [Candidatus Nanopelagicales bacterium]|jgi:hypothetical protein
MRAMVRDDAVVEEVAGMRRVLDDAPLAWLSDVDWNGFDPSGWSDSTWVLHPMWVRRDHPLWASPDLTLEQRDTMARQFTDTYAWHEPLGPDWTRLSWADFTERFDLASEFDRLGPAAFFGGKNVPAPGRYGIVGPGEGDLDPEVLGVLVRCLSEHSPDGAQTACYAYWDHVAVFWHVDSGRGKLFEGSLAAIPSLIGLETSQDPSPTNFWPIDRSWFVYSDPDSSATKVSGSASVINALRACTHLETRDWSLDSE